MVHNLHFKPSFHLAYTIYTDTLMSQFHAPIGLNYTLKEEDIPGHVTKLNLPSLENY